MSLTITDQVKLVKSSGLFDERHYLAQAPKAAKYAWGPVAHYLIEGNNQNLTPHPLFDPAHYVKSAGSSYEKKTPPLLHYLGTSGKQCFQPHLLFDARFYIESNADLKACAGEIQPLVHYLQYGSSEGRDPHPLFSTNFYLNQCLELKAQGKNPLSHFVETLGSSTISTHELFDVQYYRQQVGQCAEHPLLHFLKAQKFVSPHPIFDASFYLNQLPEQERNCQNPLLHFLVTEEGKLRSPHPLFDIARYLTAYPDIEESKLHAFMHYVRFGYQEGREPNPLFHSLWYMSKHPQIAARGLNPLLHYALQPSPPHPFFHPNSYKRVHNPPDDTDALTDCLRHDRLDEASCEEPLLGSLACARADLPVSQFDLAYDLLLEATKQPYSHLVILPGMCRGGAERAACTMINALQERYGCDNVLVLLTQSEQHSALHWLPHGTRYVDVRSLVSSVASAGGQCLTGHVLLKEAALCIGALILQRPPKAVHMSFDRYLLSLLTDHIALFKSKFRHIIYLYGYNIYFDDWYHRINGASVCEAIREADCIVTDTDMLREAVEIQFPERVSEKKKSITIRATAPALLKQLFDIGAQTPKISNKHILWASRLVYLKRPEVLAEIAKEMPELQFFVYGSTESDTTGKHDYVKLLNQLPNVKYMGAYSDFRELDYENASAFLYTTESDGMPIVLEEATALGLPIIAPRVGGIPEFVCDDTGWLIDRFDDVGGYVGAIRSVLAQPDVASQRVKAAQALLLRDYSHQSLTRVLNKYPELF